jgi:hypothetical protein
MSTACPLLRSKTYIMPWSLPLKMTLQSSAKVTCRGLGVFFAATGYVRIRAPESNRYNPTPCRGSSRQNTPRLAFTAAFPLKERQNDFTP